jgi:mono/diheme cytochrome c family protein
MILLRTAALFLALFAAQACAQTDRADKPGPMQSGAHAQPEAPKAPAESAAATTGAPPASDFDPAKLFATTCGWCHLNGGRVAGKGPQLMGTERTDAEIVSRIRNGKTGQMPAFGTTFNEDQLKAIVAYIRALKP